MNTIPNRQTGPRVVEIEDLVVGPGALAIPGGKRPRVEEPDLPSMRVLDLAFRTQIATYLVDRYPERAQQLTNRYQELIDGGLSPQEAVAAALQEAEEVINPEVEAEKVERLRMIHDPRTRDSIAPRDTFEVIAMTEERVLLIRDPATRDSIVPRNDRERAEMKAALMEAKAARMEAKAARMEAETVRMEAKTTGMAAESDRMAAEAARMAEETQRLIGMAEKKTTAGTGPAVKFASDFFAKAWGAIVAAAVAMATFFCFLGWRLGFCLRYGEKAEGVQK
ncbi:MAG: hypothetical protein LBF24_03245 [Puniceicoccales bacterium]|jgi:hypothetical protein|nr:hypothetical protein [Puniceicoccales bacterium]